PACTAARGADVALRTPACRGGAAGARHAAHSRDEPSIVGGIVGSKARRRGGATSVPGSPTSTARSHASKGRPSTASVPRVASPVRRTVFDGGASLGATRTRRGARRPSVATISTAISPEAGIGTFLTKRPAASVLAGWPPTRVSVVVGAAEGIGSPSTTGAGGRTRTNTRRFVARPASVFAGASG